MKEIKVCFAAAVTALFLFAAAACADEPTLLEKIQALPFVPSGPAQTLENFDEFGGKWTLNEDGSLLGKGDSGARMTFAEPDWKTAARGAIELDLRFPTAAAGFSGLCFKISGSAVGADAFNGYEIGFNPAEKVVNLGAHRQNYTPIKRVPYDVPVGKFFTLRVEFDETGFVFYLDGVKSGEYRDPAPKEDDPLRAGSFALRLWQNDVEYRNVKARLGDSGPLVPAPFVKARQETGEYPETLATDDLPPFIYIARSLLNRPYSVGNDLWQATPKKPGCAIRLVEPARPEKPIKTLFEDPEGSIYDMNLSFDAKTVYFSYRPKDYAYWNIWKINIDGTGLTQLTNGPFFDVSPAELPDGGIVFVSTRRFGRTV
ncbi:MAG: DUF1080 domain-containing protein, partial [Thermoguttaceae bacterium]|nr:DUF1080 domain-containing protein [Thermoguttaceae bacterium]